MLKHLVYAILFTAAVVTSSILADRSGVFVIQDVIVQMPPAHESYYLDKREQLTQQLAKLKGEKLWRVDISDASQEIASQDWILDVQIFRRFPNRLEVNVTPKNVVMVYQGAKGRLFPIASDGSLLSTTRSSDIPDVPIMRGKSFEKNLELRKRAIQLVSDLPREGKLVAQAVSEISYSENEGFQILLHDTRARIQVGQDDFKRKASRIAHVLSYLDSHSIESRFIDASFARKVLVRLKKN